MPLPGPPAGAWALALLLWAGTAAILGEPLRALLSRWVVFWRSPSLIERGLLDFYLGGAVVYLVAAVPFGFFVAPLVFALPMAAAAVLLGTVLVRRRRRLDTETLVRSLSTWARPAQLLVLFSSLALYVLELAVAMPAGTGNTFDSGLLTTYTALLLEHHAIPLSFHPYASVSILYPQGTTVWLGWAQLVYGLPPARTSLLVTPLFIALAPLAAYVFGHRWFGSDRAGVALALAIAWLAPATRVLVGGSNDFVFAFPLVLILAAQAVRWFRGPTPSMAEAVGFGVLTGYSAAINPVGAEWLLLALFLGGVVVRVPNAARPLVRLGRWAVASVTALLGVVPSLYVLVLGRSSPGFVPGSAAAPAGAPTGISGAQFLGSIDPFLFRPQDVQLSPVPELRAELAILLVLGLALLLFVRSGGALDRYMTGFRRFAAFAAIALVALLAVVLLASTGFGPAVDVSAVTSAGEISTWLFTLYVFVAALPLVLAAERFSGWVRRRPRSSTEASPPRFRSARRGATAFDTTRAVLPLAVALVIVVPGVVLTPTSLAPVLTRLYGDFGNVTSDDLALLEYAGSHLPPGARVLVAPGSAADFLPGYATNVVLLYPLVPGFPWTNASYNLVVDELSNATLDARGRAAMITLDVGYIIVTGNSTILWPAFSPRPLLAEPGSFPLLREYGDAYLFACVVP